MSIRRSRPALAGLLLMQIHDLPASAQSERAAGLVSDRISANRREFFVYRNHDDGSAKAYPSGIFPDARKLSVDPACIDDPGNPSTGCTADPRRMDCRNGTVMRITWAPMAATEFYGLNFEEPEHFGSRMRGVGYDLSPATHIVFRYRSPTGIRVQFGVNDGRAFSTDFIPIPAGASWSERRLALDELRTADSPAARVSLRNVHIPFFVVTNGANAANGGTLLLDDIRYEPAPRRQLSQPSFPLANATCGIVPAPDRMSGRVLIPPDQVNRNLTTTYETALALWLALRRGDLDNARHVADSLVHAVTHDNSGFPLPTVPLGAALRNGYINGDATFLNDQQCPGASNCPPADRGSGAKAGQMRLAGFSIASNLCGASKFCLVLDGATGGNNSFAMISLLAAYRRLGDTKYLDAARTIGNWIHGLLFDPSPGFGGYFVGAPDEGAEKSILRGKSVENNADIAAAFQMLADVESQLCNRVSAEVWKLRSEEAANFVIRMFDPVNGRFFAGTVPIGTPPSPGISPDGERRGGEVINTFDFLDANTFVPLALMSLPRYRDRIDWRRPVDWAARQVQRIRAGGQSFEGFSIVHAPVSGPAAIAWEFTGQMVVTMRAVDAFYGESRYRAAAESYLAQIWRAQILAPYADGRGLVAATMESGDQIPPHEQCVSTPFQCIAQRVGLAATLWAIFADASMNPLARDAIRFAETPLLVNGASYEGCLSPGGLFSVFGFGTLAETASSTTFPLPVTLSGVEARLGGRRAPLLYAGPNQINGQIPYETPNGPVEVELWRNSALQARTSVQIAGVSPGLFVGAENRCVAFNFSGARNTPATPTGAGEGVTVYLTGLGKTQNPVATGLAAPAGILSPALARAAARIGGRAARVLFIGLTPGAAGVGQANLEPEAALPRGDHDVVVILDGVPSNACVVAVGG